jgi:hypothetical protein
MRLLLNPPERPPEAVAKKLQESKREVLQAGARGGFFTLLAVAVFFLPLIFWMGVRDRVALIALIVLYTIVLAAAAHAGFVRPPSSFVRLAHLCLALATVFVLSRLFGPLIIVPSLAAGFLIPLTFHAQSREAAIMFALTAAALALPMVLELGGVLPRSYEFSGDAMIIRAQLTGFRELPSMLILGAAAIAAAVVPASNVGRMRRELDRARQELELRAWYLDRITD